MDKNYIERNSVYKILDELKNEEIDLEHACMAVDFLPAMREVVVNATMVIGKEWLEMPDSVIKNNLAQLIAKELLQAGLIDFKNTSDLVTSSKAVQATLKAVVPEYHNAF